MAAKRLRMRQLREVLRLKFEVGLSHRAIVRACGVGLGTVSDYVQRVEAAGLSWPLPGDLDDAALEARVFARSSVASAGREMPEWAFVHRELRRDGVTLQLLWHEYIETHPDGYRYSQFCEHYRQWARKLNRRCDRCIVPARRPSSITPGRNRTSWTGDGRGAARRALRRRARREQLHLRRGHRGARPDVVGGVPHSDGGVLRRIDGDLGPGQFEERDHDALPVRAGGEPDLRRPRSALRRRGDPGAGGARRRTSRRSRRRCSWPSGGSWPCCGTGSFSVLPS